MFYDAFNFVEFYAVLQIQILQNFNLEAVMDEFISRKFVPHSRYMIRHNIQNIYNIYNKYIYVIYIMNKYTYMYILFIP